MFKLFSQYSCLLKFKEQEFLLEENENVTIKEPCKVFVYPVGKAKAFSFALDLDSLSSSPFYKFKACKNQTYIFLTEFCHKQVQDVYTYTCAAKPCQVFVGAEKIGFLSEKQKIELALPFHFEKYRCTKIHNLILVLLEREKEDCLVVFNPESNKIKLFDGQIKLLSDGFVLSNQYFDCQYKITKQGLKNTEWNAIKKIPPPFLPYQFMQAVKNQAFPFACSLLSEKMQEKISAAALKEYLPDVQYFKFIDQNHCFIAGKTACKEVFFTLEEDFITDVEID